MPSVCILGGGYAGLRVARELPGLLDPDWSITLVDQGDCHQLITRLPELVAGQISVREACIPFAELLSDRVRLVTARITAIELKSHRVEMSGETLQPDVLVVAVGTTPDYSSIPGSGAHIFSLKSVADAVRIRDALAELRAGLRTVRIVVVGAGYTGTEVAGELTALPADGVNVSRLGRLEVSVVAEDTRLLPQAGIQLGAAVERVLRRRGIPLRLGQAVELIDEEGVHLERGEVLPADLVIWAGPTHVAIRLSEGPEEVVPAGKIRVDPYLQAGDGGHAYACGDVALIYDYRHDAIAAASAQLAIQEGRTVARNIAARARGRTPEEYRPHVLGEALGLGNGDAVAQLGGFVLTGRPALATKSAALTRYLAGLSQPFRA